jgi:hypothetical protein
MENQTIINIVKVIIKNAPIEVNNPGDIESICCLITFNGASLKTVKHKNKKPILMSNIKKVSTEPVE